MSLRFNVVDESQIISVELKYTEETTTTMILYCNVVDGLRK